MQRRKKRELKSKIVFQQAAGDMDTPMAKLDCLTLRYKIGL
jgi:hypothetical protein